MIEIELAKKFIEQITQFTDYNINIMNADGVIIASRDPNRVGTFHEVAYHIVNSDEDLVMTQYDHDYPGVRTGINQVIKLDGRREGVVGVTGDPDEIRSVALITKMAFETMLKYEKQQQEVQARKTRKERFMTLLTHEEFSDPETLRNMASELNYSEDIIRIPILCHLSHDECLTFSEKSRKSEMHHSQDIRFMIDNTHILVFKAMTDTPDTLFKNYKTMINHYLTDYFRSTPDYENKCKFFIGSFQGNFSQYYNAYMHCRWLEKNVNTEETIFYFYDYANAYIRELLPMNELQKMFNVYEKKLSREFITMFVELFGSLIQCNYNFVSAAKQLFVHKNTLIYRYNKIKDLLGLDPINQSSDRAFLEAFYDYLIKDH